MLFAASDDSTLLMLSLEKGEILEKPLRPKNASRTLAMELLDYNGTPVPPPQGAHDLCWAVQGCLLTRGCKAICRTELQ